jgi:hypothetical protein
MKLNTRQKSRHIVSIKSLNMKKLKVSLAAIAFVVASSATVFAHQATDRQACDSPQGRYVDQCSNTTAPVCCIKNGVAINGPFTP